MIKKIFIKIRSKFYFIPTLYSLVFISLALFLSWIDNSVSESSIEFIPRFLFISRSIAEDIFIMEIGSLITILTITFSIMMVVLTIYGNQLSPRTLQDFTENKTTQRIMGYIIGVLVYSITCLFFTKSDYYSNKIITPSVGILLFFISIGLFAYFIHFISKSVQITLYIQKLVEETSSLIEKKQNEIKENPRISNSTIDNYEDIQEMDSFEVKAPISGFIQYYNEKKLFELSKKNNIIIWCEKHIGEHILEDTTIIKLYGLTPEHEPEKISEEINEIIAIGNEINLYEDIGAGTKKLTEIAVRALSPGINDPNTAVFCIEKIGFLLHKIAKMQEARIYINDKEDVKLIVQGFIFKKLLFDHFYQIKHYGIDDLAILDAILGALITISKDNSYEVKKQIWAFYEYLVSDIGSERYPELEKSYLKQRIYQLSKEVQHNLDFGSIFSSKDS